MRRFVLALTVLLGGLAGVVAPTNVVSAKPVNNVKQNQVSGPFTGTSSIVNGRDYWNDRGCRDLATLRLLTATVSLVLKSQWDEPAARQLEVRLRYWMADPDNGPWNAV